MQLHERLRKTNISSWNSFELYRRVSIAETHVVFELSNKKDIYIIVQISSAFLLRATSLECDEFDEFIWVHIIKV